MPHRHPIPVFRQGYLGNYNQFYLEKAIGKGGFGQVFSGFANLNGYHYRPCAFKLQPAFMIDPRSRWMVDDPSPRHEVKMHRKVSGHRNIVAFFQEFISHNCHFTLLELCEGGSLHGIIRNRGNLEPSVEQTRSIFVQLTDAIQHCHRKGIHHCDIKSENILFTSNGEVKLADFGLATEANTVLVVPRGSPYFMAPEAYGGSKRKPYSGYSVDIWALGMTLVEFITGKGLWRYPDSRRDAAYREFTSADDPVDYLYRTLGVSLPIAQLLNEIFNPDPKARPSFEEIRGTISCVSSFLDPEAKKTPSAPEETLPINAPAKSGPSATLVPPPLKMPSSRKAKMSNIFKKFNLVSTRRASPSVVPISGTPATLLVPPTSKAPSSRKTKISSILKKCNMASSRRPSPSAVPNSGPAVVSAVAPAVVPAEAPLPPNTIKNEFASPRHNKIANLVNKIAKPLRHGFQKISWPTRVS